MQQLQAQIPQDVLVLQLLAERQPDGRIPRKAYHKWCGAHWVLAALADLGYPPGDESLLPLREQVFAWLLDDFHINYMPKRFVNDRMHMHPSIEGNAVYYLIKLGLADERIDHLARLMLEWRWPDGGWNCDIKSKGHVSSFNETLIPLRALVQYRQHTSDASLTPVIKEVAEVFLKRHLFRRLTNGNIIHSSFTKLFYPYYWHYSILAGLKVLAEAGLIGDPRCSEALDLLESKRLPEGGFPANTKYYRSGGSTSGLGYSTVDWGGTGKGKMNPWVTLEALAVLKAAGRKISNSIG